MARRVGYLAAIALALGACGGAGDVRGGAPAEPPDCAAIEAFAEQLVDIGITYDYEPSSSPAELAEWVDAVVLGTLTGEVSATSGGRGSDGYVGYEIAVSEVLAGEVPDGDTVTVSMPYDPSHLDADVYEDAVVAGAPVLVFAWSHPDAPGGFTASAMEGFMTACEAGEPLGWVSSLGAWSDMDSLGDVARAARGPEGTASAELDGHLDCAGDLAQSRIADRVDGNGDYVTAVEAVEKELTWLLEDFPSDARIVHRGAAGSIVTDGREVAETRAREGDDGRWFTDEVNWCVE